MQEAQRPLSPMQMKTLDFWQASGFRSKAAALRKAGYGRSVIDQPHKVFGSLAVIQELSLRGFDEWGRRRPPQAYVVDLFTTETNHAVVDFSNADQGWLLQLKAMLDNVPSPIKEYEEVEVSRAYVPATDNVDIFKAGSERSQQVPRKPSFSSM